MMFASRTQLLDEVIKPALDSGTWVLCDRYVDSSVAYQGGGRELGVDRVWALIRSMGELYVEPDLTFVLDIPTELVAERLADRQLDRFEREDASFFDRVRKTYLKEAAKSARTRIVDAARQVEEVQADIIQAFEQYLSEAVAESLVR